MNLFIIKMSDVKVILHLGLHTAHCDLKWARSVKLPFLSLSRSLSTHLISVIFQYKKKKCSFSTMTQFIYMLKKPAVVNEICQPDLKCKKFWKLIAQNVLYL